MKLYLLNIPLLLAITFSLSNPCAPSRQVPLGVPPDMTVYEVSVAYPRFEEASRFVSSTGAFTVSERLALKSEFDGVIEKVYVGEGDQVSPGDPLCLFRGESLNLEIQRKQAELREAEATLELDRRTAGLQEESPSSESPSAPFLDEETNEHAPSQPRAEIPPSSSGGAPVDWEAKVQLDQAKVDRITTELDQLEEKLQKLTATSPIAGVIQKKYVTEGGAVDSLGELFDIVNTNPMTLTVTIPQDVASYVDKRSVARAASLTAPDILVDGSIFYISPEIDPVKRTLEVRLHIPNDNGAIKEGQQGKAMIATRKMDKMLVIPRKAVVQEEGKNYIYVVQGEKVSRVEVELGQPMGIGEIEINANIRIDDPIVLSGSESLKDGSFVKIAEAKPAMIPLNQEPSPANSLP